VAAGSWLARSEEQTNAAVFDGWSLVHVLTGTAAGLVGLGAWLYLAASLTYELVELYHESPSGSRLFGSKRPEDSSNLVADVGLGCLGYALGVQLRTWSALAER
jgi:hypothetical protein